MLIGVNTPNPTRKEGEMSDAMQRKLEAIAKRAKRQPEDLEDLKKPGEGFITQTSFSDDGWTQEAITVRSAIRPDVRYVIAADSRKPINQETTRVISMVDSTRLPKGLHVRVSLAPSEDGSVWVVTPIS